MLTRTTTALLEALLDPDDDEVWHDFDRRYRPILVAFARRLGLPAEDAADAAQDTLTRFVGSYRDGKYDRDRGRLRSWIIGIARHCIYDIHQRRATDPKRGLSAISELPDESALSAMWDEECAVLGRQHWHTAVARRLYGDCLATQGRHDQAKPQLLAAHDTLLRILGPDHAETRAAATALKASKENST